MAIANFFTIGYPMVIKKRRYKYSSFDLKMLLTVLLIAYYDFLPLLMKGML